MVEIETQAIVQSKGIPIKDKERLLQREIRSGKKEVFNGLKQLKKAIQYQTTSLSDVGTMAKKTQEANRKINKGRAKILYARRQLHSLQTKKYWK